MITMALGFLGIYWGMRQAALAIADHIDNERLIRKKLRLDDDQGD